MSDYFGIMGTALYSKLAGGTALIAALGGTAIYAEQAPDGQSLPYVVFSHVGGGPENITPREMYSDQWNVRAYAATRAQANALDGHLSGLLHKGGLSVTGYTTFWMVRETSVSLVENPPNGAHVYMAGGLYRVRLSE